MERVDVVASGYEWICPNEDCEQFNTHYEWNSKVICATCKREYETNPPEHCLGV